MRDDLVERQRRLTTAAPTPLAQKMRAAGPGERRPVTVVFADVVNSTLLTASMDPEEWTEIINDAFRRMSAVIYRYEGTIARLMGDGILAFFGAPVAHEDDPERAVRCALDMIAAVEGQGTELRRVLGGLSWSRAMLDDPGPDAIADLDRALETARQMHDPYDEGTLLMLRGMIRARSDATRAAAIADFAAAKELFTAIGARPALVRTLRAWADALEGAGCGSDAAARRSEANVLAEELGIASTG